MDAQTAQGFAAIAAGLTVFVLIYAIYSPVRKSSRRSTAVDEVFGEQGYQGSTEGIGKYIQPILKNFMPSLPEGMLSANRENNYRKLIREAGNPWRITPEELFVLQLAFGIIGALIGGFVAAAAPVEQIPAFLWPIAVGGVAMLLPYAFHTSARDKRTKDIQKNLPEALDLLTVMIRSGQTFEPALRRVTTQLAEGFLREEFTRVNIELQAGTTLSDCMRSFAASNNSDSAESFAKAIIQAQKIGADVTDTLTQQAVFARDDYEARLEKMIARLSTTMFIPLTICMLPAFMIIFIAPAIGNLSGFLG